MRNRMRITALLACWLSLAGVGRTEEIGSLTAPILKVGKEGQGHAAAQKAWKVLTSKGPDILPEILSALDGASPRAANWLRSAFETIAFRAHADSKLNAEPLEAFVRDTRHSGPARRLAYEWLVRIDATTPDRLLPGMLNDPGAELRRDAVDVLLKKLQPIFEKGDKQPALKGYREALEYARDRDQVDLIADRLKKLGQEVDLTSHYGFITRWALVGPFDNTGGIGFDTIYPPEKNVDLKKTYQGKGNQKAAWFEVTTEEKLGLVDLNKEVGALKGAVQFAYTVVSSPEEKPVEIRAGSNNAVRIYLNGKEIYFREEYHHGMKMDQHVGKGVLKAGRNEILVKVCQNEQTDSWAQQWSFQLRICDSLGSAVPVSVVMEKVPAKKEGGR